MNEVWIVYTDEGFGPTNFAGFTSRRDALLDALHRLGDDMDEALTFTTDSLEDRLNWLQHRITDFGVDLFYEPQFQLSIGEHDPEPVDAKVFSA